MSNQPSYDQLWRSRWTGPVTRIAVTNAESARNATALPTGVYLVSLDQPVYLEFGQSDASATSGSFYVAGGSLLGPIAIDATGDGYLAALAVSDSGSIWCLELRP